MKCPIDVAEVLAEILYWALLRIRGFGFAGDARRCADEADHVHNLPGLINNYSPDLLLYYWERERPSFRRHASEIRVFEDSWQRLEPLVKRECAQCKSLVALSDTAPVDGVTAKV